MATASLVSDQIGDARVLIEQLKKEKFDVTAAFWVKTSEEGLWSLYIASDVVEKEGLAASYRRLYGEFAKCSISWLSQYEIKLIGRNNPITADVIAVQKKHPAPLPTRYHGRLLGDLLIDEAYIYPC